MRLVISNNGEHTVSTSQTDERCFNRNSKYEYSYCRMILAKIIKDSDKVEELDLKYVKAASGWDRETHIVMESLEKGDYFVFVELDWNESTEDTEFCSTCYGASKSFFLRDEKSLYNKNDILRKLYASKAVQMLEGVTVQDFSANGAPDIKKYKGFGEELYGFVHFVNDSKDATFKEKVNYTTFTNLSMLAPNQGSGYDVSVAPGERKTIVMRSSPDGYAMSSSSSTSVSFGGKKLKELCKENGKKNARPDPETGEAFDIWQYSY